MRYFFKKVKFVQSVYKKILEKEISLNFFLEAGPSCKNFLVKVSSCHFQEKLFCVGRVYFGMYTLKV